MDELTISGKTYISSKQAAKITGYAKDYVGQLCREGRVDAKLVGRNWYVLESSIREHRFGKETAVSAAETPEEAQVAAHQAWEAPTYRTEEATMIPPIAPRSEKPAAETAKLVSDMQDAWKEWFAADRAQMQLPTEVAAEETEEESDETEASSDIPNEYNSSEEFTDQGAADEADEEYEDEGGEEAADTEEVAIERIPTPEVPVTAAPRTFSGAHDIAPVQHRVVAAEPVEEEEEIAVVGMTYDPVAPRRSKKRAVRTHAAGKGKSLVLQAALLSIAGIIVILTILGVGALDTFVASNERAGLAETIINYFQGETRVIKQ